MIAGLMQNFARDVIVPLKFKHSRERVIVILCWVIVDVRFGGGVAKLFAAWRRRFDPLKIADVFPPARIPLVCRRANHPSALQRFRTALDQASISGPGLRMLIGEPQKHKADNRHQYVNRKNQSHVSGREIVHDDKSDRRLRPMRKPKVESVSRTETASSL
jgi:hypothetical protein